MIAPKVNGTSRRHEAKIAAEAAAKNVLGGKLETCSTAPMTGFYRDGCCRTGREDAGSHTVCAVMTEEFLEFSVAMGNDLVTPNAESGFPGLRAGDRWCVCVGKWREAMEAECAPPVVLGATHEGALGVVTLEELKKYAVD